MKRRKISYRGGGLATRRDGSSEATGIPTAAGTSHDDPATKVDENPDSRAYSFPTPAFIHSGDKMHQEVD